MPQPARKWGRPATVPHMPTVAADAAVWEEAASRFLTRCRAKDLTPKSLALYAHVLAGDPQVDSSRVDRLGHFRREHGIRRVDEFTGEHLQAFEAELFEVGLSNSTVLTFHRTIKTFLRFCADSGLAVDPSALAVSGPMSDNRRPDTFTDADVARLLAGASRLRDRTIIETFRHTGVRLEELCGLNVGDVIEGPGLPLLAVHGKGGKDRYVPLDTKTVKMSAKLRKYIEKERKAAGPAEPLFVGRQGERLGDTAVKSMLQRLGHSVGVEHCHAHRFRHTFATRALGAGADALELQQALGHASLTMVSRYVHHDATSLSRAWAKLDT